MAQVRDCREPASPRDSLRAFSTTKESTITSLMATEREAKRIANVAVGTLLTTVARANQAKLPKIPDKTK